MKSTIEKVIRESPLIVTDHHSAMEIPRDFDADLLENLALDNPRVASTILLEAPDGEVPLITPYEDSPFSFVRAHLPRAILDAIRRPDQVDYRTVEGQVTHDGFPVTCMPNGHYWAGTLEADESKVVPLLRKPWNHDQQKRLQAAAYHPMRDAILEAIERARAQYGHAIVLDSHTAPRDMNIHRGVWGGHYAHGPEVKRAGPSPWVRPPGPDGLTLPDVILIVNSPDGRRPGSCTQAVYDVVKGHFEKAGLYVEIGSGPLLGDYGPPKNYADRSRGVNVISVEMIGTSVEPHPNPGRRVGARDFNLESCNRLRGVYGAILEDLARLPTRDLK